MDETNDLRLHPPENSHQWGIRYPFENGRVHVDKIDSLASGMTSVAPLRRPPTLRVIQGGRHAEPRRLSQGLPKDRFFLVVVK